MEYSIQYNPDHPLFVIRTDGDFEIGAFLALVQDLLSHPDWVSGSPCLFDYRNTNFLKVDTQDLSRISHLHRAENSMVGNGRSALVMKCVGNYGMGMMYKGMTEAHVETQFGVFTDIAQAREWVGN